MSNKYATVHYRCLRREDDAFPDMTLAQAIQKGMDVLHRTGTAFSKDWRLRVTPVPRYPDNKRFVNDFFANDETAFGNICVFTPGEMQALLETDSPGNDGDEADRAPIEAVDISEGTAPKGMEYLHGIAYWLAVNDHLFMVQHTSLQSKSMEEYLTWFLRDATGVIGEKHYVELQAKFDIGSMPGDIDDVQSIEVGGLVPETVRDHELPAEKRDKQGQVVETVERTGLGDRYAMFDKARKIIEDLLGEMEAKKIMETMPSDAALEVTVNIGYRSTKRKLKREFMKDLASGLRNLPEGELHIRGKDGNIKGDEARLHMSMPFKLVRNNSSLLDLENTRGQLIKVYQRFLEDGKILEEQE